VADEHGETGRQSRKLMRMQKTGIPTNLLVRVGGLHTVAEMAEPSTGKGAKADLWNLRAYLDLLAERGDLEWVA
jgi:hypothetical protein